MRQYQFQYTIFWDTLIIILGSIVVFMVLLIVGLLFKVQTGLTVVIALAVAFLLFQTLKKRAVRQCTAQLNDTSVEFVFDKSSRVINFDDLISFKAYYGKNGPVLYLKNGVDNFTIAANSNYCKIDAFEGFCKDMIIELDKYKAEYNSAIIHEGSIFATKGMFYFLSSMTAIYLLAFFVETNSLRLAIGMGGGFYLLIMWLSYYTKQELRSK